ncbi:telomere repeats-binding bouquet formation protein 1-like isoform X2 [Tachyglossus aculeatus]|uniref:telomere repeats-binding bouquet formation protein 1-like isoform X2 n=1 Tax=Tachyglossus aculeatus TaxID=9261 RepID=UPI0018F52D7B|nr:telomere repeats-binding bouquet formation protein 1-like isoform X2 [Tachyglossus aculeatus]XP_038629005.1 telomere repeats-binding bouquet formation protein 1-like isoform X2 [Tachyglossus aculeatus]
MEAETYLDILLEYIKKQLDNVPVVKIALLSIVSICQENSNASVYFQDIGGLKLVRNLARSDAPNMLKEFALHALGALANSNVLCQQSLCTPELFDELMTFIVDEKTSVNSQTVSISVLLNLVSKNSAGQMLLRETGCIPVLQKLFRETLTKSEIDFFNASLKEKYFLWNAVCNTLAAAVNNPQNKENQTICSSILPHVQTLLEARIQAEIIHPLCLLIGLTVAGNTPVKEFFISMGGLDVLADIFTNLAEDSRQNMPSAKMAVSVTCVMGLCIAQNQQNLILLLKNNGLKLIIDSFSASHNEIVGIIVSVVLQNCTIWAEQFLDKLLAYVSNEVSEMENQGRALGHLKKTKETLTKEQFKREEDEEQGPKTESVVGDSLQKDSDQEKALPKQCSELGAQIYHPSANDELESQLESPGGVVTAPEDERRAQQPPKEEQH